MAVLNLEGASVLSYSVNKRFLGETVNIGCTENLTVKNIILDGDNHHGVQGNISKFEEILNTDQHVDDIVINGHNFGEGRLMSVDFSSNNPVRVGEYTAQFEIYTTGNLVNLADKSNISEPVGRTFKLALMDDTHSNLNLHLLESLTENTNSNITEDYKCTISNNVSVKFLASGKNSDPVQEAKTLARYLMHFQVRGYPLMEGFPINETEGGPSEWTEDYDLINLNFNFSQTTNLAPSAASASDSANQHHTWDRNYAGGLMMLDSERYLHQGISPYHNYTTRTLSYNENGSINVTENGEIQFRATELTNHFPDQRPVHTVAEHVIRAETGPPLFEFPHDDDGKYTTEPAEYCYQDYLDGLATLDMLPRSWRRCNELYNDFIEADNNSYVDGASYRFRLDTILGGVDGYSDNEPHDNTKDTCDYCGDGEGNISGIVALQCQAISIGKTINSGSSTASYNITYTDDPKVGRISVHEYTISVSDSETQIITVAENGTIRPYSKKAVNFGETSKFGQSNIYTAQIQALTENDTISRMAKAYNQYFKSSGPTRKLTVINRNFGCSKYGKEISYSMTSNDDPANINKHGIRRLEVGISDNAPVVIHNLYQIPGLGNVSHRGQFPQTEMGSRSITLTSKVSREAGKNLLTDPPNHSTQLTYLRSVIWEEAEAIMSDMNNLLIQDVWISNLTYTFNSADFTLTVAAEVSFVAARHPNDLNPRL